MGRRTTHTRVVRYSWAAGGDPVRTERSETLVVEEPLEIRLGGEVLTVTMRLPGDDIDLAHGLLLTEGIIRDREDVALMRYCVDTETLNVLEVTLRETAAATPVSAQRRLVSHGGCGLCGKTSIEAVLAQAPTRSAGTQQISAGTLVGIPQALRESQQVFARTGGSHAAALAGLDGDLLVVREDIGRHNAVDKVIGAAVQAGRDTTGLILAVTSRASFEIVQKAAMAGVGTVLCVSAPSSLAVEAAQTFGITLVAFARPDRMTVCCHPERIVTDA